MTGTQLLLIKQLMSQLTFNPNGQKEIKNPLSFSWNDYSSSVTYQNWLGVKRRGSCCDKKVMFRQIVSPESLFNIRKVLTYPNPQCQCGPLNILQTTRTPEKVDDTFSETGNEIMNTVNYYFSCDLVIKRPNVSGYTTFANNTFFAGGKTL